MTKRQTNEQGLVMVLALTMVAALMVVGLSLLSNSTSQYQLTNVATSNTNAIYLAEAGVEQSVQALNADSTFSGYPSEQVFFNNSSQGYGTYTVGITPASGNPDAKVITSTGKIYRYNNHTDLLSSRTVQVTVVGTTSDGYSVMTGPGGLILSGSAKITNSSVYVGGTISLNGSASIGTNDQPLDVFVANKACPTGNNPGSTYPTTCTSSQAIDLKHSTYIYGSTCATGQTNPGPNNNFKTGNGGQGLIIGCTAPDVSQPSYDKAAHLANVSTTAAGTSNTYVCNNWPFTRTWPANLQLNGNVSIASSCDVTITGDVYITGDLNLGGAATIRIANSLGTTRPVILVDGKITAGGSAQIIPNSSGTGAHFISWKSNAPCASSCTSITGTNLKNTQSFETISVGGAVNVPGVVFQSYWGKTTLSGSGNVGSAVGQTVDLSGAGTVTFGTELSSGVSTWTISSYQIKYPGD